MTKFNPVYTRASLPVASPSEPIVRRSHLNIPGDIWRNRPQMRPQFKFPSSTFSLFLGIIIEVPTSRNYVSLPVLAALPRGRPSHRLNHGSPRGMGQ